MCDNNNDFETDWPLVTSHSFIVYKYFRPYAQGVLIYIYAGVKLLYTSKKQ